MSCAILWKKDLRQRRLDLTEAAFDGPTTFEIFPWNRNFETGLADIDEQHKVLVDILNRLAWHFASDASEITADRVLDELLSYAAYHFQYEEQVWAAALGDSDMSRNHHDTHQMFFARIQMLKQGHGSQEDKLTELFDYLTRWLAFHILESDRGMALTIRAMNGQRSARDLWQIVSKYHSADAGKDGAHAGRG